MGDVNLVQRITDAASVNGQTFADIQADSQGKVDTHAVSGIHSIIPASGDLILGGSGIWSKLPKGADNLVLRVINGVVTWDTGNGVLSFIPNLGDLLIGNSGSWDRLIAGKDDNILRLVSGIPAWDTDAAKDPTIVGQWTAVKFVNAAVSHPQSLSTPRSSIATFTFNVNGTFTMTEYLKDNDLPCFSKSIINGTWTQDATGVFKASVGTYHWQIVVGGNFGMMFLSSLVNTTVDIGFMDVGIMARGVDITALVAEYTANLCTTQGKPVGIIKGVLVNKTGVLPTIPNNVVTAVTWDQAIYDMLPAFWSSSDPTKLIIPSGVSQVRLHVGSTWGFNALGERVVSVIKNGSYFPGTITDRRGPTAASPAATCVMSSPIIPVSMGDYFQVNVWQNTGGDLNFGGDGNLSYFGLEIVA